MPSTDIAHAAICLRASYAMPGTDIAYGASRRAEAEFDMGPSAGSKYAISHPGMTNTHVLTRARTSQTHVTCTRLGARLYCSTDAWY
eukprot:3845283-Rhodomonas_salina.2